MKTPHDWKLEFERNLENFEADYPAMIEAIQKDALSDPMASPTDQQVLQWAKNEATVLDAQLTSLEQAHRRLHEKWLEQRRYLRAANRGAQRNARALELATARYSELIRSDKRWQERDQHKHQTVVWNWLLLSDLELCEKANISLLDVGACRSMLKAMLGTNLLTLRSL